MQEPKVSEAQQRAIKNWDKKNREKSNYIKAKSATKSFIKNKATKEDLQELIQLINDKIQEL
ncbi:hypothetical protein DVV91_17150 [Clostridium botulinum]|uniref:hypothetical protein n=1 Tax=Clostridium botulinum TaxID=1491 RepID=UPI001968539A|nr:hypothetical protein [Clostridium botulinum]MBN1076050.1 hypothetical protein [Clostridium botulinum]